MPVSDMKRTARMPQPIAGAKQMIDTIKSCLMILKDRRGVTAVEYAVIAGVMATAVLGAFTAFSAAIKTFLLGITL